MDDLAACPNPWPQYGHQVELVNDKNGWHIRCTQCEIYTQRVLDKRGAIAIWNGRIPARHTTLIVSPPLTRPYQVTI